MITMKNSEKTSGNAILCSNCIHKDICAFSKDFEKFSKEIVEKKQMIDYQHFTAKIDCNHYIKEQAIIR